jgi:transposase, IS5 family
VWTAFHARGSDLEDAGGQAPLYNWSYEQTEHFVNDSIVLRQFTRLYLQSAPDDTTLIRWANVIGSETVRALNDRAVELARSLKVTRGRKLRTDGTVVETNIHYPTDDTLISDGVRVIGRLLRRAKSFVEESVLSEQKGEPFRNRVRSAKRLALKISRMALRRSQKAKAGYRAAYERLLEVGKATARQAGQVGALLGESPSARKLAVEISRFSELLEWAVGQARRRVLGGQPLEAEEKLLSLFEEHTAIIRRGKARRQTEFGRKVWLSEVDGGIISGFRILEGNAGDEAQLRPALEDHLRLFGKPPELVAADRNVHSRENERIAQEEYGVEKVCLPKAGKKSAEREEYERQGWYKRARRFRPG